MAPRLVINVYVAGGSSRSSRAVQMLEHVVDVHLDGACDITVIDVTTDPAQAEDARIITTPTYVLLAPVRRRIIGLPESPEALAIALELISPPLPTSDRGTAHP